MSDDALYGPDDRVTCGGCARMQTSGFCTAHQRKEITTLLRRCWDFLPRRGDPDQRTGAQRWATNDPETLMHLGAPKALITQARRRAS